MKKIIIGLDPGSSGAIAVLDSDGKVIDVTKMPETCLDIYCYLADAMKDADETICCLEDVGHGIPGQSSSATAKFARHCGHLEMALTALKVKTITARPQLWQKIYHLGRSSEYSKHEWKNRLKAKAQQLFPNIKVTLINADALLIAEYARIQEK